MKFGMHAVMTARPNKGEELASLMLEAADLVAKIDSCEAYIVQLSTSEKDTVLLTEIWKSPEAHQASLSNQRIQQLIARAHPMIAGMTHHTATPLGGHGL
ncbi:MAG: quinol monooxygenase YgiN [Flavobacteriales bacterium]|jgi:quinol monooxygenase YgiN